MNESFNKPDDNEEVKQCSKIFTGQNLKASKAVLFVVFVNGLQQRG
jgi:hypothetical protein